MSELCEFGISMANLVWLALYRSHSYCAETLTQSVEKWHDVVAILHTYDWTKKTVRASIATSYKSTPRQMSTSREREKKRRCLIPIDSTTKQNYRVQLYRRSTLAILLTMMTRKRFFRGNHILNKKIIVSSWRYSLLSSWWFFFHLLVAIPLAILINGV